MILDTDIGTDIDDAYALILAATSPELDLQAVTIVNNGVELRGRLASKILRHLRLDRSVALGESNRLDGTTPPGWKGIEGKGIDLPTAEFAMESAKDLIATGGGTIVGIGQMTNIALALRETEHEVTIYQMATHFHGYGREAALPEHNAACDLPALQETLDSNAKLRLVGLNVTRQTGMGRPDVRRLEQLATPLANDLAAMHHIWLDYIGCESSPMHDPLTVAAVFRPGLIQFQPMRVEVDFELGAAVFFDDGDPNCEVAVEVDADAFHRLFFAQIFAAAS
jgi:purine nucleosidase